MGSDRTHNSNQIVEKANEHPDWLPVGWSVDFRTRKSGPNMGAGYKCYIEPLNGNKFYSKPEVLRYLNAQNENGHCMRKECTSTRSPNNVAVENSGMDNSLPESTKEVKIGKNDNAIQCDQASGEDSMGADLPTRTEVKISKNSIGIRNEPVAIEKSALDDLPPGWTKEVKIRKNGSGIKKDPYYTDPVNGYVFRSKKDVWRYIESGDITKCLFKPTRRQIEDEDNSTPSSTAKRQKVQQPATKQQLLVGREISEQNNIKYSDTNSSERRYDTTETVVQMRLLEDAAANTPEMINSSDPADVHINNHVSGTLKTADEKNHSMRISNKKGLTAPHRFSRRLAGAEPDLVSNPDIIVSDQDLPFSRRSSRKSITTLDGGSASVSSQQVPKAEHLQDIPNELLNKSNQNYQGQGAFREQSNLNSPSNVYSSPTLKGTTKTTGGIGKFGGEKKKSDSKKVHIPHRASKRLAGFEPDITKSMLCDKPPEYRGKMSKVNIEETASASSSINVPRFGESSRRGKSSPKMSPKTCEHPEKLGKKQLDDEKSEPQLSFAFHYSWSDPSVEFAIQSLTGALSVDKSVDKGPVLVPETDDIEKTKLSKNITEGQGPVLVPETDEVDKTKLFINVDEGQGPVLVPETDEVNKIKLFNNYNEGQVSGVDEFDKSKLSENGTEGQGPVLVPHADTVDKVNMSSSVTKGSNDKSRVVTAKKSKTKEPSFPRRLSKRLAGHEPEIAPADRAVEYASKKSCKDGLTAAATSSIGALKHIDIEIETQLDVQAPTSPERKVHGESSNKEDKSKDVQIVPSEQLQKVEAGKVNERSESEVSLPFGDSWSDPCFEFAIKTLTGALPVGGFEEMLPVMTPDLNCPPNIGMLDCVVEKCINEEEHDNMNQSQNNKDINKVCQLSKQLPDQPAMFIGSTSCEKPLDSAIIEAHGGHAKISGDLKQSQEIEDINKVHQLSKESIDQPQSLINFRACENANFATIESQGGGAKSGLKQSQYSEQNEICQPSKQSIDHQPLSLINFRACENANFANIESHGGAAKSGLKQSQYSEQSEICQPSKQSIDHQPQSLVNFRACENANFANIESHRGAAKSGLNQSQYSEQNEICQPSKQLLGQPESLMYSSSCEIVCHTSQDLLRHLELRSSSSCEDTPKFIASVYNGDEAKITNNLDERASLNIEAGNHLHLPHQSRNMNTSKVQESSNKTGMIFGQEFAAAKQPQYGTWSENQNKFELQFSPPLVDTWSDPCLEFAYKTLTGALPVEENLSLQRCFQEPASSFYSQKDASPTLPDFLSPSLPQPAIPFHYNVKPMPEQQTSVGPSILPPERVNPRWFAGFDSQKHYSQSSKNSQGR